MEVRKKINKTTAQVEWKIKKALRSDLPRISSFFKNQFRGYQGYGRMDMFVWKIFENTIQEGFIHLIEDDNIIASTTSITPKRLILNNKKIAAAEIGDTYTSVDYQRKGMFSILINASRKRAQEEGVEIVYGTPNNQSLPGYLKNADFKIMETLDVRSLTFSFSAKAKFRRLAGRHLAELLDAIYRVFARTYSSSKKITLKNNREYSLELVDSVPTDWDGFWSRAALKYEFIFDRSAELQEWRYFENPEKYSFLTIRHLDSLVGYCIYRNTITDEGQDTSIADYLFLNDHEPALNLVLDYIFNTSFKTAIRLLNVWCDSKSPYYAIFRNRGLKDQNEIPVIFYSKENPEEINRAGRNHFTIGDSDNV